MSKPTVTSQLPHLTGDDEDDQGQLQQFKAQALVPLKEDLADWLNTLIGPIGIDAENFMDVLDDGIYVCQLARLISTKAQEAACNNDKTLQSTEAPLKTPNIKFREGRVEKGSWFARDNATNFINWCRQFGVKDECLFETEGLVLHRDPRNVVLCLLELARLAMRYGIQPPTLIRMEKEIELEERMSSADCHSRASGRSRPASCVVSTPCISVSRPSLPGNGSTKNGKKNVNDCRRRSAADLTAAKSVSRIDQEVTKLSSTCKCCGDCYSVQRLSEGRYLIGGRIVFVRLLKDRHVMVRVGGGWDTLEHYLQQHDPCKFIEYRRSDVTDGPSFLCAAGLRYKAS
jgi:hypothetical protein